MLNRTPHAQKKIYISYFKENIINQIKCIIYNKTKIAVLSNYTLILYFNTIL